MISKWINTEIRERLERTLQDSSNWKSNLLTIRSIHKKSIKYPWVLFFIHNQLTKLEKNFWKDKYDYRLLLAHKDGTTAVFSQAYPQYSMDWVREAVCCWGMAVYSILNLSLRSNCLTVWILFCYSHVSPAHPSIIQKVHIKRHSNLSSVMNNILFQNLICCYPFHMGSRVVRLKYC